MLLTGATGFFGAHLLAAMLKSFSGEIVCLVRAKSKEDGLARLRAALEEHALFDPASFSRLRAEPGDVAKPLLGLDKERFEALGAEAGEICHSAAWVNHLYPLSALKPANVAATHEVLRLACEGPVKPVHFISTLGVGASLEETPLEQGEVPAMPYLQSKWVAEKLLWTARDRGLPVASYRPGLISWSTETGVANPSQVDFLVLRACVDLGAIPAAEMMQRLLPNLTPVDFAARAVVRLIARPESLGRAFHLLSPNKVDWASLAAESARCGRPLETLEYDAWVERLRERSRAPGREYMITLKGLLAERIKVLKRTPYSCEKTVASLAALGVVFPRVEPTFARFLERLPA